MSEGELQKRIKRMLILSSPYAEGSIYQQKRIDRICEEAKKEFPRLATKSEYYTLEQYLSDICNWFEKWFDE